jgi:hypothetical protein
MTHSNKPFVSLNDESCGQLTLIVEFGAPGEEIIDEKDLKISENDEGKKGRRDVGDNAAALVVASKK